MEKSVVLVHSGRLVDIHENTTALELESYRFFRETDFDSELVTKSIITSRSKLHWKILDVRNVVDDRSGITAPVILASHNGTRERRFCVIQANWNSGNNVTCLKRTDDHSGTGEEGHDLSKNKVRLVPVMEFTCNTSNASATMCSLLYGPRVLITDRNKLSLFSLNSTTDLNCRKNVDSVKEFHICDNIYGNPKQSNNLDEVVNGLNGADNHGKELESAILCVASEKNWLVTVLRMTGLEGKCSLVTVSVERHSEKDEFNKYTLRTSDFLPQEYAPKVSSLTLEHCKRVRTGSTSEVPVYRNTCLLGLTDGYVMTLADGVVQICVTPWTHINAAYPVFAVTHLVKFGSDTLICLTDTKHCFIINETTKQVKHHWDGVTKALVGDFLQCGGQQLLLLFDSCQSQRPPDNFLLTDLQGFTADQRESSCDASLSEEIFPAEEDEASRNLQPVINALLEQNQALARKVGEEKQKLANKQTFAMETWTRLMHLTLSVHGSGSLPDVSPPEVPLTSLVGHHPVVVTHTDGRHGPSLVEPREEVQVHSLWHRLLDGSCVVGVKVTNVSHRELCHCALTLTPHTSSQTPSSQALSTKTTVWQCFHTNSSQQPSSPHTNPHKRQKTDSSLRVQQTQTIQSLECVTVTCVFEAPGLGWHGELAFHVNLVYGAQERNGDSSGSCSRYGRSEVVGTGVTKSMGVGKPGEKSTLSDQTQGVNVSTSRSVRRTKNTLCGKLDLKASELLQQTRTLDRLVESDWEKLDSELVEGILALNSVQQQWQCEVDFVLHEATEIMAQCLRSAGFVYRSQLGQYWMSTVRSPSCLHWVRVQLLGFAPHPRRAASVVVLARDSNQFLLLLRHLYTHLPDDANITLATEDPDANIRHLVKLLTTQLSERRRQAQALLETHKSSSGPSSQTTVNKESHMVGEKGDSGESSGTGYTRSQAEEFAQLQRQYQQNQRRSVSEEDVGRFKAAVLECDMETDMAMAKVKL